jgi:tetratricopeptide (TPR) repeat protein
MRFLPHLLILLLAPSLPGGTASGEPSRELRPAGPVALPKALAEAEASLSIGETQIAESRYRTALLEGWLLIGALSLSDGDAAGAERAFLAAEASAAETRRPRLALAMLRLRAGAPEEAATLLRRVIGGDSTDLAARRLLADALASAGQVDEAIQELEELRALAPDALETIYLLATAHLDKGDVEAAEVLLADLAVRRPIAATHVLTGRTYRDFGHYERARRSLRVALEMDARAERAHYYLGTVDLMDQEIDGVAPALVHFEAELAVSPDDPLSNLYLGMALVEARRHQDSLVPLTKASLYPVTRKDALHFLGGSYLALDRPAEAIPALAEALALTEAEPEQTSEGSLIDPRQNQLSSLHYQLAQAYRRSGDETAAAIHFAAAQSTSARIAESSREALRRHLDREASEPASNLLSSPLEVPGLAELAPDQRLELRRSVTGSLARAYQSLGVLQMRRERFTQAADLFLRGASLDPELPRIHYSLGAALFNSGQFASAVAPLERALETRPDDRELTRMLALAALNAHAYRRAAELLEDDPERAATPSLQYAYGMALVRSGETARAVEIFADLLERNADWPELNVLLGQAHAQQNDYATAFRYLERAIELDPAVAEAHSTLGDMYLRQGELVKAEVELETELRLHPEDTRASYTLAVVLDLQNRAPEAEARLRDLLEAQPRFADARYLLGKVLLAEGNAEEALVQLEAAARLSPEDANTHYQLGLAYQRLARDAEAERAFETFRRLKQAAGQPAQPPSGEPGEQPEQPPQEREEPR